MGLMRVAFTESKKPSMLHAYGRVSKRRLGRRVRNIDLVERSFLIESQ